jgi:plastocyanin
MSDLDSRALRQFNMFGQKFSAAGNVTYRLGPVPSLLALGSGDSEFIVEVTPAKAQQPSGQHHVTVRLHGGKHVPDQPQLQVAEGDVVTWNAPDATTPPFIVEGTGPGGPFSSAAMRHEAIYTHVFTAPGDYRWVDANGSGLSGDIHVNAVAGDTEQHRQAWLASLNQGVLIHIQGTDVQPASVQLTIGMTVFWAVERTNGIAIADVRLAPISPH